MCGMRLGRESVACRPSTPNRAALLTATALRSLAAAQRAPHC